MQLIVFALSFLVALPALATPASIKELEGYLATSLSGRLDFFQSSTNPEGDIINSSGVLSYARPDKFRLSYEFPDRLEIVSNGKDLWIHDFALNQVIVSKLVNVPGARGFLAVLTADKVGDTFSKSSKIDGVLNWLVLVPYNLDEFQFNECSIAFDENGVIKNVKVIDLHGNRITAGFTVTDAELPIAHEFEYEIPSGTEIIQESN